MSITPESQTRRLFVALALPADLRARLARIGALVALHHGARAVPGENLHVTVDFLGDVASGPADELCEALAEILPGGSLRVRVGPTTVKPTPGRARLVAVGLHDVDGGLAIVARRVTRTTALVLGRPEPARPFWPHVTVARFQRPTRVRRSPETESEHVFDITRAALYHSDIAPGRPPRYHEVLGVTLGNLAQRSPSNG